MQGERKDTVMEYSKGGGGRVGGEGVFYGAVSRGY